MTTGGVDILDSIVSLACIDVFGSYRMVLRELPKPAKESDIRGLDRPIDESTLVAAVVGFNGSNLRGSLVLTSTFEVVSRARPPGVAAQSLSTSSFSDWVLVRDWAGELGNQILGGIKNRLRPYGISFEVGTPAAFTGRALSFAKPKLPMARAYLFEALGDKVWVWLDSSIDPSRALVLGKDEGAKAGDIILF